MELPFEFGELVMEDFFVNRTAEKQRLKKNLSGGLNTMLISPRRWGKSSLVKQVFLETEKSEIKFCFLDLFQIKDEQDFYTSLAREVIKQTSSKWDEWIQLTKEFFKTIRPKISIGVDPMNDFELSFEASEIESNYIELLDLAENIAKKKKLRLVICVDEFQNLSRFKDPLLFQQRLRACWQKHKHVSYCLYGSKRHMMIELFQNKSMPFYKFGDIIMLEKINSKHWIEYIQKQFKASGKEISKQLALAIVDCVKNHSYYVQQLSLLLWYRTDKKASNKDLEDAIDDLMAQNSMLYSREVDHLSNTQINFLEALADGATNFHSSKKINQYKLGSSSNVSRIKEALEKKEIIDTFSEKIEFLDPVFELWFNRKYMVKN